MKITASDARYLRVSKLNFVCLIILIWLMFFRAVAAPYTTNHPRYNSGEIGKRGAPASGLLPAQDDSTRKHGYTHSYWVNVGWGWGGQGRALEIGFSYEVAPKQVLSLRYSGVRASERFYDYFFLIPVASYPSGEDAAAAEITYGLLVKGKAGIISLYAGLSLVKIESGTSDGRTGGYDIIILSSDLPDDYRLNESSTIGFVLGAQFTPSLRWGGIGISPCVNINPEYTFARVTIHLALGKMREKARKRDVRISRRTL